MTWHHGRVCQISLHLTKKSMTLILKLCILWLNNFNIYQLVNILLKYMYRTHLYTILLICSNNMLQWLAYILQCFIHVDKTSFTAHFYNDILTDYCAHYIPVCCMFHLMDQFFFVRTNFLRNLFDFLFGNLQCWHAHSTRVSFQ